MQKLIGSSTDPAPYLHVAVINTFTLMDGSRIPPMYAIYVWDTREVVESEPMNEIYDKRLMHFKYASDNHTKLVGDGMFVNYINSKLK